MQTPFCNAILQKGVTDSSLLESGYSFLQDYSANALHEIDAKHL